MTTEIEVAHGLTVTHSAEIDVAYVEIRVQVDHALRIEHEAQADVGAPQSEPEPSPPAEAREAPFVTWRPDGETATRLTGRSDLVLFRGVVGLDQPPDSQHEAQLAMHDGALLTGRRRLPREVIFQVALVGNAFGQFETSRRELMRLFDPKREGVLTWALPDGTSRRLRGRVSEVTPETGHTGVLSHGRWRVVLRARDPYWLGDEKRIEFIPPVGGDFYGGATAGAPPYLVSESTTFGETLIDIDSDEDTWPVWVVDGPATEVTLANVTTGKTLELTPGLAVGETLTVRTEPRTLAGQRFTREDGSNVWAAVAGQFPQLWPFIPGTQAIEVVADGTGEGSLITLRYEPRYLTA